MPRRHAKKVYMEDSYYHIFNRGVNKSPIFRDHQDYMYFTKLLIFYLTPFSREAQSLFSRRIWRAVEHDLSKEVQLVAYCLMPNHYHLVIRQQTIDGLTKLMKRVSASYSRYYNNRYERSGHLFEGPCQARLLSDDNDVIGTCAYVHRNPKDISDDIIHYPYSNFKDIAEHHINGWSHPDLILSYFDRDNQAYSDYVCSQIITRELELVY